MSRYNYGFTVRQQSDWNDPDYNAAMDAFIDDRPDGLFGSAVDPERPTPPKIDKWRVYLPSDLLDLDAAGENYGTGQPHADAVASLENFIAQAQEALRNLQNREDLLSEEDE
jgi:hypothetical protein